MTSSLRSASLASLLVASALALGACGGSDDKSETATSSSESGAAAKGAASPEEAIQAYFTAKRLGKAADGCALETERYQTQAYGSAGQACLDDAANKMPQAVWAERVEVVSLQESGESAAAVVQPNAGTDAQAQVGLVRVDGGWLVDSLQ